MDNMYSLVNHKYYCHKCQKNFSRLLPRGEPIVCEQCGDDFTEIIEQIDYDQVPKREKKDDQKNEEEEEKKQSADEESKSGVYEEEDIAFERPTTGLREEDRSNTYNPFYELFRDFDNQEVSSSEHSSQSQGPHAILNDFFGGVGGIDNLFNGMFVINSRQRQPQNNMRGRPQMAARGRRPRPNPFSGQPRQNPFGLFGLFDFPTIFNDDQFGNFGGGPFGSMFDPGVFMNNFHSNFRSSDAFQEFLNRTAQMHQPTDRPAAKEAVEKLPIIKVNESHCKKKEDSDDLEPPSCPVCIDEIGIGKEAMFMPCGHTFHPDCLKPWLAKNNTCPICRKELPAEE